MRKPRRIGLALGSGAARGAAHIGVLRALNEVGIRPACVAGTSVGALVGAIYLLDNLDSLENMFQQLRWRQIAAFLDVIFPKSGLIDGHKVADFIREHVQSVNIEDLPLPFAAVTTNLTTGQQDVIREGDLIEAIRASISIPGIFTPLRRGEKLLVDGGLVNPVPVSVAREMGADYVIAVSLSRDVFNKQGLKLKPLFLEEDDFPLEPPAVMPDNPSVMTDDSGRILPRRAQLTEAFRQKLASFDLASLSPMRRWWQRDPLPNIFEILLTMLYTMQTRIAVTNRVTHPPDLFIEPPAGHIHFLDFKSAPEVMRLGYEEAKTVLASPQAERLFG